MKVVRVDIRKSYFSPDFLTSFFEEIRKTFKENGVEVKSVRVTGFKIAGRVPNLRVDVISSDEDEKVLKAVMADLTANIAKLAVAHSISPSVISTKLAELSLSSDKEKRD